MSSVSEAEARAMQPGSEAKARAMSSGSEAEARAMQPGSEAKARLRAAMRSRRAGLDAADVAAAGVEATRRLESLPVVAGARRVAAYRAVRGEIPLDALLDGERRNIFTLPRVVGADLEFVACTPALSLEPGSFGILEPVGGEVVPLAEHDAVLIPLTAFDGHCHRLGQGGGFYDRALASLPSGTGADRPASIGVAYAFQQVAQVPRDSWDVPLDAVVTDADVVIAEGGLLA